MTIKSNSQREAVALRARRGELGPSIPILTFIAVVVGTSFYLFWSSELFFDDVGMRELTEPRDEVSMSLSTFAVIRTVFAVVGIVTLRAVIGGPPLTIATMYDRDSKIRGPVTITFDGIERLATFTVQTFTMQTVYHIATAVLTTMAAFGVAPPLPRFVLVSIWICYEVAAACSLLVTVIVTFVLIPGILKRGGSNEVMFMWAGQVMHNCNLLFMLTELLLNRLPFVPAHFCFAVGYGMWYVVFSWCLLCYAGVVFYPFLDPSKPWHISLSIHIALLSVFAAFYYGMMHIDLWLAHILASGPFYMAGLLYVGCYAVTWTSVLHRPPK